MGLPNKGSKTITVKGDEYRYIVSANSNSIDLIIELNEMEGQRLIVHFDYSPEKTGFCFSHTNQITPSMVKIVILHFVNNNWKPQRSGKVINAYYNDVLV